MAYYPLKNLEIAWWKSGVDELKKIIFTTTGFEATSLYTDLSTQTGDRVMIFKLSGDLQHQLV